MQSDELKSFVQSSIREEWSAFAAKHPHLAAAIDDDSWTDVAMESIDNDPAFHAAMANAQTLGTILDQDRPSCAISYNSG